MLILSYATLPAASRATKLAQTRCAGSDRQQPAAEAGRSIVGAGQDVRPTGVDHATVNN
ncbi:MAG: hypothetical protein ACOYYU_09505 [Chloroflexota bacterium]